MPSRPAMSQLLVPLLFLAPVRIADEPFTDLRFEPAVEKARVENKLLLVDFSAGWCDPCHRMEKDTWGAAEVRTWLAANAIAIQVDYDAETKLAERFAVQSLPTIVAVRDGAELDRLVGYHGPEEFLKWGRDASAGKSADDALRERARALMSSADVEQRLALVAELVEAELYDEALEHYRWLWSATRADPRFSGAHFSTLLDGMAALARVHEPARAAFASDLARLQAEIDAVAMPSEELWRDWCAWCAHFDATERVLVWYEQHRDEAGRLLPGSDGGPPVRVVEAVFTCLVGARRLGEAARLVDDGPTWSGRMIAHYRTLQAQRREAGDAWSEQAESYSRSQVIADVAALHATLLHAGRQEEATAVGDELVRAFDAPDSRLALAGQTIELAGREGPDVERWLVEAERRGGNTQKVRKQLVRLRKSAGPK